MRLTIYINRSDGAGSAKPAYQRFDIDTDPEETVAGALEHIYENLDPTLSFRFVCNMQKCGECAVLVNKKPCLACDARVEPEMYVDPLPNLPVIRDLVVDRCAVIENVVAGSPLFRGRFSRPRAKNQPPGVPEYILKTGKCIECLMCQSACPVLAKNSSFPGPLGILWLVEMTADAGVDPAVVKSEIGRVLDMCNFCGRCGKTCPDGLNIMGEVFKGFEEYRKEKHARKKVQSEGGSR
jgi:succinate dehydrogenase/fumarate reductase iron-sulfur protein